MMRERNVLAKRQSDPGSALWQQVAADRHADGNPSMAVMIGEASIRILCDADEQLARMRDAR